MPPITGIPPEILRDRHRLSSQQVNALFGRKVIEESLEEKAKALGKVAEFLKVTDALKEAGVSFVPLKGPLLSFRLNGDATYRYFRDLDILVDASAVTEAKEIIDSFGYQDCGPAWPSDRKMQHRTLTYSHHLALINPVNGQIIELHWRLMNTQWLNFRQTDNLIGNNITTADFAGRKFSVLNNELELLYLVIHGGLHRWGRLKWLADVHEYLKSQKINWEIFNEFSDSLKAGRLVALCNTMLAEFFPGGPLIPCSSSASKHMVGASFKTIAEDDYSGPETIREIMKNLPFGLAVYPGVSFKVRLLCGVVGNSIFHGRMSRLFQ